MDCLLRPTKAFTLGMHALALLARHYPTRLSVGAIADLCGVSKAHLAKVIQTLARNGLVKGERGPKGGITLNESADSVSLLDIWNAIEGPSTDEGCIFAIPACGSGLCPVGRHFAAVDSQIRSYMEKTTLQDLTCMADVWKPRKRDRSATETADV
jgi:Rrf2 family protein